MANSMMGKVGGWSFIIGIVLAVIVSLMAAFGGVVPSWAPILLAVLGLIVGFLNITGGEVRGFLVASVAFLLSFASLASIAQLLPAIGSGVGQFFTLMGIFVAPAAAVVAFKELLAYTRD